MKEVDARGLSCPEPLMLTAQALKENKISQNRYERYIKIYEELKDREEHKW